MTTTIKTIEEIDYVSDSRTDINNNFASLNTNKQEVESGKGLSTNDFTNTYKDKLVNLSPNYSLTPDLVDDINDTLNTISGLGGGVLILEPGTYTLTSDINIPSGCTLEGKSRDACIIDCGAYSVKMNGSYTYDIGTVTINNGDTEVVGAGGATFTSDMVGQSIWLDFYWYEITGFTDTTHIDIDTYTGANLSGASYVIATLNNNSIVKNISIINSTGNGLEVSYSQEPEIDNIDIYDCLVGCNMDYVVFPIISVAFNYNGTNLDMNYVEGFLIDYSEISLSTADYGVKMINCSRSNIYSSSFNDNASDGIYMEDCYGIQIQGSDVSGNGACGIKMQADCDNNSLESISVDGNTTYGINIVANTCNSNVLVGVIMSGNGTASLNDVGTGTLKSTAVNILP